MKPVPCRGSTNIRRQCKKTQTPSDLAPGVYTPLDYFHTRAEQEIIFEYEAEDEKLGYRRCLYAKDPLLGFVYEFRENGRYRDANGELGPYPN